MGSGKEIPEKHFLGQFPDVFARPRTSRDKRTVFPIEDGVEKGQSLVTRPSNVGVILVLSPSQQRGAYWPNRCNHVIGLLSEHVHRFSYPIII